MRKKIDELKLDSYKTTIPLPIRKDELVELLGSNKIPYISPSEMQVNIKSTVFSLGFEFSLAFCFENDTLLYIVMSPEVALSDKAALARYKSIQSALEGCFGRPRNFLQHLTSRLDPYEQCANWQLENATIEHRLFDRFGIEDTVKIDFGHSL